MANETVVPYFSVGLDARAVLLHTNVLLHAWQYTRAFVVGGSLRGH